MAECETATREFGDARSCTLSVVMPNYNHAKYIENALKAILSQRRQPDEIILIDDGSTDDSRALIEQWAAREPRIRPIYNSRNFGAIASINIGIEAARGRYVCLMAADDMAYPAFFSTALDALGRHREAALFCAEVAVQSVDEPGNRVEVRPVIRPSVCSRHFSSEEARGLLRGNDNFIVPLTAVFRRDLLIAEGGLDPVLGSMADGFLSRRLALKYGFCFAPEIVVRWNVRSASLSQVTSRTPDAVLDLLREAGRRIETDPIFPHGYAAVFDRRLRFGTCRIALITQPPGWDFVQAVGPRGSLDRVVFSITRKLPQAWARNIALAWLALRLKPYSLYAMVATSFKRWRERRTA